MDRRLLALLAFAVAAAFGAALARVVARRYAAWRLARRMARARRLEVDAAGLLAAWGYEVLDRQVSGALPMRVDGQAWAPAVRADYLVRRRGRRYVAEVKTGAQAPDPADRATRRQLLEYGAAWRAHGLLLVDAEAGRIREIDFPSLGPDRFAPGLALGLALGTLVGAGLALWWVESG